MNLVLLVIGDANTDDIFTQYPCKKELYVLIAELIQTKLTIL